MSLCVCVCFYILSTIFVHVLHTYVHTYRHTHMTNGHIFLYDYDSWSLVVPLYQEEISTFCIFYGFPFVLHLCRHILTNKRYLLCVNENHIPSLNNEYWRRLNILINVLQKYRNVLQTVILRGMEFLWIIPLNEGNFNLSLNILHKGLKEMR
jgi:hypothetical protein